MESVPDSLQRLTGPWLHELRYLEEVDSTNRLALELAQDPGAATPLLVVAAKQTRGRGRQGRSWFADAGGLTCSFMLRQSDLLQPVALWSQLAPITGIAVAEAVETVIAPKRALVKWPNDVYVTGRKAAGILVESVLGALPSVVIGIGVNVAANFESATDDVKRRAVSLDDVAGRPLDRWEFLEVLVERLSDNLTAWAADPRASIRRFQSRCYLSGRHVEVRQDHRTLSGRCEGLGDSGGLLLRTSATERMEIVSGEVVHWSEIQA